MNNTESTTEIKPEFRTARMFIPEIGTEIELAEDFTFMLYREERNKSLLNLEDPSGSWQKDYSKWNTPLKPVTLLAGTKLKVDRIYIRQGMSEYSSITFTMSHSPDEKFAPLFNGTKKVKFGKRKPRFWVKLSDVNEAVIKFPAGS